MQSYQMYIWQAAWLNANLDKLELGMTLEPELLSPKYTAQWKLIQDSWKMGDHGYRGNGILHPDIGCGEYLDKHSIEKAKIRALAMGRTPKRLGIKTLVLTGFVVDADPFLHWFDPHKLRSIHFKGHCIDAGFWLAHSMRQVTVRHPKAIDLEAVPTGILSLNLWKDLKVVGLKGGKKVEEVTLGEVEKCRS
ncbi:hypothetical protein NUU61_005770 [Penicillium alfredii]|uniref:Uncharacterized protein n=1 Tax=Penicillium alfredii TaxID=1506179 RepID=A0A9W9FA57_9EURO|nr:uncharacterized protein NUU61_005770 [Penicillium alfredii]KAJ5096414.1 hypothetical protein NUU61_005770 [Penicillium alfredii]